MQLFNTFVACVIFASSVVANPAVQAASGPGSASYDWPTVQCLNDKQKLTEPDGLCIPALSQGFKSSTDCMTDGGRGYYCVDPYNGPICLDLDDKIVGRPIYEGGECFSIIFD